MLFYISIVKLNQHKFPISPLPREAASTKQQAIKLPFPAPTQGNIVNVSHADTPPFTFTDILFNLLRKNLLQQYNSCCNSAPSHFLPCLSLIKVFSLICLTQKSQLKFDVTATSFLNVHLQISAFNVMLHAILCQLYP